MNTGLSCVKIVDSHLVKCHCQEYTPRKSKDTQHMTKQMIETQEITPLGPYSPAVKVGNTIYFSGQISYDAKTQTMIGNDVVTQTKYILQNLKTLATAAGGSVDHIVKLTVYLTDVSQLSRVNEIMPEHFKQPYPARTSIGVVGLPKGALIEMDAIMVLPIG